MGQKTVAVLVVAVLTCLVQQAAALQRLLLQQQVQQLTAFQQCGGTGNCRYGAACGDRTWPNTYCLQGYTCWRYDVWYWQCRPGTGSQSPNNQPQPQPQQQQQQQQYQQLQQQPTVNAWNQCGGSKCKQGNCGDQPWATCPGGYTCVRRDRYYWQCRSQSTTGNANANSGIKQEQGSTKPQQASNTNSAQQSSPNDPDAPVIQEVDESVIERMAAVPSPSPPPPPPPPVEQPVEQQQQPLPFFFPFFG